MFYLEQITASGRRVIGHESEGPIVKGFFNTRATLGACGVPYTLRVVNPRGEVIESAESDA